jgi:hypothetical protein
VIRLLTGTGLIFYVNFYSSSADPDIGIEIVLERREAE